MSELLETVTCYLTVLTDEWAEVEVPMGDRLEAWRAPAAQFRDLGIQEGDDFFLLVYADGRGEIQPAVFYGPKQQLREEDLLTFEQLEALAEENPW